MGRIIRLLVTAAVAWAAWHGGMAAWKQFQFSDEVATIAKFGPDKDAGTVMAAVLEAAAPLRPAGHREGRPHPPGGAARRASTST